MGLYNNQKSEAGSGSQPEVFAFFGTVEGAHFNDYTTIADENRTILVESTVVSGNSYTPGKVFLYLVDSSIEDVATYLNNDSAARYKASLLNPFDRSSSNYETGLTVGGSSTPSTRDFNAQFVINPGQKMVACKDGSPVKLFVKGIYLD
jgi:hypothetical protein